MVERDSDNHSSFTLLELVIVGVIISILAATGTTMYQKAALKSQAAKAKNAMALITEAEKICQIETGSYKNVETGNINTNIGDAVGACSGINLEGVDNDIDWVYVVDASASQITAKASRGACVAKTISFNIDTQATVVDVCFQ